MIAKTDILMLLSDLNEKLDIDTSKYELELYSSSSIPLDILKFINSNTPLELVSFYEKLRHSYNNKKSKLYINIVKCDEENNLNSQMILTTLTALLNQIMQFKCEDIQMFLRHSRAAEISSVLAIYCNTLNIEPAYKLLKLIKADLVVSEFINGRRK